jgi:hypothetical protein
MFGGKASGGKDSWKGTDKRQSLQKMETYEFSDLQSAGEKYFSNPV